MWMLASLTKSPAILAVARFGDRAARLSDGIMCPTTTTVKPSKRMKDEPIFRVRIAEERGIAEKTPIRHNSLSNKEKGQIKSYRRPVLSLVFRRSQRINVNIEVLFKLKCVSLFPGRFMLLGKELWLSVNSLSGFILTRKMG
jgi:hypothetical protein